ncbi:Site-specific recombinase XerD [Lachnospiraceae bacterium]|nr:Site-specific recombinase XerD [Lachnospiraceae bacterium]
MSASLLRIVQPENYIEEQCTYCKGVSGVRLSVVKDYLQSSNINSLHIVNEETLLDYRNYVENLSGLSENQSKYYKNSLEQIVFAYLAATCDKQIIKESEIIKERAVRNKTTGYLILNGIQGTEDITYSFREKYEKYLKNTISDSSIDKYLKSLDLLKLSSIKKLCEEESFYRDKFLFKDDKIFLLYHPEYKVAESFYYIQNKSELVFDFSLNTSELLKRQVFSVLKNVLETNTDRHDRRERFIVPLGLLYSFSVEYGIEDLEQLLYKDVQQYKEYLRKQGIKKIDVYSQIIENVRKYLFLNSEIINWSANVWYMARFNIKEEKLNPAREILKLSFDRVNNNTNRECAKKYIKYMLGPFADISIQTLRCRLYDIIDFLEFLDKRNKSLVVLDIKDIEDYENILEDRNILPETFNTQMYSVESFINYLVIKTIIPPINPREGIYYKKVFSRHINRRVFVEVQNQVLESLIQMPFEWRLIFLCASQPGLRISEACSLKGNSFYLDDDTAWLRMYQGKLKKEKMIPIPKALYYLMTEYIKRNNILANEYIFKNKKGGAYDAGTFTKSFKKKLKEIGITEYNYKSHDFRHCVATELYEANVPLEVIRDYLGHDETEMTKRYVDDMQSKADKENDQYFKNNKLMQETNHGKNKNKGFRML